MDRDRLPPPANFFTLEKHRKNLAELARPIQCSLAVADLANHIGDPRRDDSLTKENVKDLAQIMGVLSTEAAVSQLPKLDMAMTAWKAEKTRLRESMLKGIQPPSLKHELASTTLFCEGLFPEKRFKELDVEYADKHNICEFPALSKLSDNAKRRLDQQVLDPTVRKKSKSSVPTQSMPPPAAKNKLNKLRTAWGRKSPQLKTPATPAGKGKQGYSLPPVAPQSQAAQSTSRKGKAAEQLNQPGTSNGSKATASKPHFQGNRGNAPKLPNANAKQQGNKQQLVTQRKQR